MFSTKFIPEFEEWLIIRYNKSFNRNEVTPYSILYFQKTYSLNINEDLFNTIYQEYVTEIRKLKINNLLHEYAMEELCRDIKFKDEN